MAYHLSFLAPQWLCRQAGGRPVCQQISAARSATTQNKTKTQRHVIIDLIFMFPVFNSGLSVGGYHIYLYICSLIPGCNPGREEGMYTVVTGDHDHRFLVSRIARKMSGGLTSFAQDHHRPKCKSEHVGVDEKSDMYPWHVRKWMT